MYTRQITHIDILSLLKDMEEVPGLRNFVEHNCYLAGGAVRDMLRQRIPNDYDWFFRSEEAKVEFERRFKLQFHVTPFCNYERLIGNKKVQFITMYSGTPEKVVGGFDWCINQVWIDPSQESKPSTFFNMPYADWHDYDFMRINLNATHVFSALERLPRFLGQGYKISPTEMQKALILLSLNGPITKPRDVPKTFSSTNTSVDWSITEVNEHKKKNSLLCKFLDGDKEEKPEILL